MSNFDRFHPALQHHIVNSLGWRDLRPFQAAVIPPILDGQHLIILAPTAGGKTEAAFFPVLSRMLSEGWTGLSVLYVCPIKALLNNLDTRLERYCTLLGRRSTLWHGDVKTSARRRVLREPPDCLLTTPESLEVMLVSPKVDAQRLFSNLQVVIVDEIHAFAGDDRGWHLLAVLERVSRLAGRELQRIGLSATVGNPETLVDWLVGLCAGPRGAYRPPPSTAPEAAVELDYVGSLENAAEVISRLHRGEKRLVFIDSRSRAEQLGHALQRLGVTTFVTHSSLSQEQRHQAEEAFATRDNCVIVATSALELGVDVGDLDRVIQIDAPTTVASFLQRMGRTGRRPGAARNCLFLATKEESLVQAAGLIDLWSEGFVEPVVPPPAPYHILAQQLMALALQLGGVGRSEWFGWIDRVAGFAQMPREQVERVVAYMVEQTILWEDDGILWLGREGEEAYGRRNFLELYSVFLSPPLFSVLHGRQELGHVDETTFLAKNHGPQVLLLGGRSWRVSHIDWQRRMAYVEPSDLPGRSRWSGSGVSHGYALCQAIRLVLAGDGERELWSRRARETIAAVRQEFPWLQEGRTAIVHQAEESLEWWTFGGARVNAMLANELGQLTRSRIRYDSFALFADPQVPVDELQAAIEQLRRQDVSSMQPEVDERAIEGLKFSDCLSNEMAVSMLKRRLSDYDGASRVLAESEMVHCTE